MEALTAAAVAALTVYDMTKGLDKSIAIERVRLLAKSGGKSGDYRRTDAAAELRISKRKNLPDAAEPSGWERNDDTSGSVDDQRSDLFRQARGPFRAGGAVEA